MIPLILLAATLAAGRLPDPRADLAAARAAAATAVRRADALDRQARTAAGEAERLDARLAALAVRVQAGEAALTAARLRLALAAQAERDEARRLAARRAPLARLLAVLERQARRPAALALVQPGRIDDAAHARALLAAIRPAIAARTAGVRHELARAARLRAAAAAALAAVGEQRAALAAERLRLARGEAAARDEQHRALADAAAAREEAAGLDERARSLADLAAAADRAAAVNARLASLPGPLPRPDRPGDAVPPADPAAAPAAAPLYRLPVIGHVLTGSGEAAPAGLRARGLTLATMPGAQVVAPAAGLIAYAGAFRTYGGVVIVDHGGGWTSVVAGLAEVRAEAGRRVVGGSPIGRAGPRITIELRHDGTAVDVAGMAALLAR